MNERDPGPDDPVEAPGHPIAFADPDFGEAELEAVLGVLRSTDLADPAPALAFEQAFAAALERRHAIGVASGTLGLLAVLQSLGIGPGDEVIASPYSWHHLAHAVAHTGATLVFADIDYWSHTLDPAKAAAKVTARTRAIVAANTNGHPAAWAPLRELASAHRLALVEDSSEALGSRYAGRPVGSFGDVAVFDFASPSPLAAAGGGMLVTDDTALASALRQAVAAPPLRPVATRFSVAARRAPLGAPLPPFSAALGLVQLARLPDLLARRARVADGYLDHIRSFEGIKPPYAAPEVEAMHRASYAIHLGTRFTRDARDQIVEDLRTADIDAHAYAQPLHLHGFWQQRGWRKRDLPVAEKIAERAIALPLHAHLTDQACRFIVKTAKDASANVGAGAAIY